MSIEQEFLRNLNEANRIALSIPTVEERLYYLKSSNSYFGYLLYDYYTDPIMEDKELLRYIENHRIGNIPREGTGELDTIEVLYLMRAYRSAQYKRFMYHILRRYGLGYHPISGNGHRECCICWRQLDELPEGKDFNMNTAITASDTATCICPHCLIQLSMLGEVLKVLNDDKYNELIKRS